MRVAAACLMVSVVTSLAGAHEERNPKRDRLELRPNGVRVVLDYAIPQGDDARALRELFDRDHSGALDENERARMVDYLAAQASRFVELRIDDHVVTLSRVALESDVRGSATARLGIRLVMEAAAAVGHAVRFSDQHKDRAVTVPVVVALADGLALVSALPPQPFVFAAHPLEFAVSCDSCKKM